MQIRYLGKVQDLTITFTSMPYTFQPGAITDVDDPDDQQTLLAHPTSFERVTAITVDPSIDRDGAVASPPVGASDGVASDDELEGAVAPTPRSRGRTRR